MTDDTYNGWANRETWAFYLHLSNDQGLWDWTGERVRDIAATHRRLWGNVYATFLGETLIEYVEALWEECEGSEWVRLMRSDVGSVWRIDCREIGGYFISDFLPEASEAMTS
jgi:hypothetical protein